MDIDYLLIAMGWVITIVLLIIFVPKEKYREAQVAFLFKQVITWVSGLVVTEYKLIEYPVRIFPYANKTSFSFEYFIYPAFCAIFITNFPEGKSRLKRFAYYFSFCTALTIVEVIVERYTKIIKYIHWTWYLSWITFFITFYISRLYYIWFFKIEKNRN